MALTWFSRVLSLSVWIALYLPKLTGIHINRPTLDYTNGTTLDNYEGEGAGSIPDVVDPGANTYPKPVTDTDRDRDVSPGA